MSSDPSQTAAWTTSPSRLEAFTDGVLAIAITLLVLELRVPEEPGGFGSSLLQQWPSYLAYAAAFAMIGSVWIHHHLAFARVKEVDLGLLLLNLAILASASVLPFPTAVLSNAWRVGDQGDRVIASVVFGTVSMCIAASYLWLCARLVEHASLLKAPADTAFLLAERRRIQFGLVLTAATTALALVAPLLALVVFAVQPLLYVATLPRSLSRA